MTRMAAAALIAFTIGTLSSAGGASAQDTRGATAARPALTDVSSQSRRRTARARARTRVRVTPVYPYRTFPTTYPVPYTYEAPGPGHVRQCASWLAQENRLSGTVIVPRMRCWWEPGRDLGP